MWWIIGIIVFSILCFLWVIVRSAARSVDEKTQAMYDEEQSKYIENYFQEKQNKKAGSSHSDGNTVVDKKENG